MTSKDIRDKYIKFFVDRGHKEIAPAKLVPENDPTTLFISSGMQPLVPYLLGQEHPEGKRLVDSQPSFRAEDIDEVGDNRHTTFFEMLGNWSLGGYFKKEQLEWFYQFLTEELKLDSARLHVTYFEGSDSIPKDEETFNRWQSLGIPEERIYPYGIDKNWWSRSGSPEKMPIGEIGGTDSEVFYEFPEVTHNPKFGDKCHPHCDCGRFMEIGNSVFIEYKKTENGFEKLPNKNVDFGGGLERLTAATLDTPDVFQTDLYKPITDAIVQAIGTKYEGDDKQSMRIITDHVKAATFLIINGVEPSNKLQGYVLRRLLRRSVIKLSQLKQKDDGRWENVFSSTITSVLKIYDGLFGVNENDQRDRVIKVVNDEIKRFETTLSKGLKEVEKIEKIDGKKAFDLYQTFGFPYEVTEELFRQKGQQIDKEQFKVE